ncbi:thyroglobulin-like [Aplochiton taeniatus]
MEMIVWLSISCCLLINIQLTEGKASEYQLESESLSRCESLRDQAVVEQQHHVPHCSEDGRFRNVQCLGGGRECWCVDGEGTEIMGTRSNNSVLNCQTPCQLQRQRLLMGGEGSVVPRCQASGEFESVQCDSSQGQCWCVDMDGMELYGTRQNKRPSECPNSCEVRARQLIHAGGERSPPQCSDNGSFLPVQCKFINMTDRMEVDMRHNFNRFPEALQTFSIFRQTFPSVSSYCYCADSRGRELPSTGVELLLAEIYDTAFSGLSTVPSFTQSNIYRVLQRRLLGLRLVLTGFFRCPTACERERSAALQTASVFVPSCGPTGDYSPKQCQSGGQCWCVDRSGGEISKTQQQGDTLDCQPSSTRLDSDTEEEESELDVEEVDMEDVDDTQEEPTA